MPRVEFAVQVNARLDVARSTDEVDALVDQVLSEQGVVFFQRDGVTAAGFRNPRARAWHQMAFAVKDQQGACMSLAFQDDKDYPTSFRESWGRAKFELMKSAFWEPMSEDELAALGVFNMKQLPANTAALFKMFEAERVHQKSYAVPAVYCG
jgi:hypothetical protein